MPIACVCFIGFIVCLYLTEMVENHRKAQKTAELEKELSELNTTLMISQIQPHFLYNALNTIKYTIKKDPKVAESSIIKFSNYLRANMDSLTQKEPIPIAKELVHVKNYIDIEQLRFGDRLKIEYDIDEIDFNIPALTIQPIVENAIKHGLMKLSKGGTIKVVSYETEQSYCIRVEDDGAGFDTTVLLDEREHVGLRNIRERLKAMVNGRLEIESVIGKGTKVLVTIPKEVKL
jgi:LytS/YehU family sensor histidine kinase